MSSRTSALGEMHEGPEALSRFKDALKRVLTVPKSVVTKDSRESGRGAREVGQ